VFTTRFFKDPGRLLPKVKSLLMTEERGDETDPRHGEKISGGEKEKKEPAAV
jgi:hypothetical protein